MAVAYLPRVLRSLGEICESFGVGEGVVKQWAAAGGCGGKKKRENVKTCRAEARGGGRHA